MVIGLNLATKLLKVAFSDENVTSNVRFLAPHGRFLSHNQNLNETANLNSGFWTNHVLLKG